MGPRNGRARRTNLVLQPWTIPSLSAIRLRLSMDSDSSSSPSSNSSRSSEDGHIKRIQTGNAGLVSVQATTAEAVRVLLRDRLREDGKVTRVPQLVAQRLRLDSVDESFVRSCRDACIVEGAKSLDELETLAAKADLLKGMCRQRDKKKMYPALNWLFEFITCYRHDSQTITARGSCRCSTKMGIKGEEHTAGFPRTFPDGVALAKGCTPDSLYWRDVRAFVGCKASPLQGEPSRATTIPETVVQGADYARLHLSADPFRVFSVGLLIYGFRFMVAIYDQDGVCISDSYHLRNNLDVFIRVIYQLGHGLSDLELGRDPTVEQLHLPEGSQLRKALDDLAEKQGMPTVSKDFPSYKITLKTSDIYSMDGATKCPETGEATWVTIGPPVWSSLSYLGRGTTVWRVVAIDGSNIPRPNEVLILKNAWRRSHSSSESSIYVTLRRAIGDDPLRTLRKGIAEFRAGADVTFPGRSEAISVNNLRYLFLGGPIIPPPAPQTPVLHRLILATQGRALWYCENLKELLRGMGAALRGHKFLVSKGILHRDISAEYARLNTITDIHTMKIAPDATTSATHTVFKDAKRGAEMTGTLQFMAAELLEALEKGKGVRHEVHHDLESFVWVLAYAVSRHLQRRSGLGEAVKAELRQHFVRSYGRFLFADITDARISLRPLRPPPAYEEMLPQGMNDLYVGLQTALNAHFVHIRGREPKPLTHDILLDLFDTTHHSL
ncbi:Protein kinase domain-containing protein [Pleurotus pulmonarius]